MRQYFNLELLSFIDTNTLDYAIGARLQQLGLDRRLQLVIYYTRSMTLAKQNYNIHNKELLAIIYTLKK